MAEQLEEVDPDVVEVRETNLASVCVCAPSLHFNFQFVIPTSTSFYWKLQRMDSWTKSDSASQK